MQLPPAVVLDAKLLDCTLAAYWHGDIALVALERLLYNRGDFASLYLLADTISR